jgi:hypothetical protein
MKNREVSAHIVEWVKGGKVVVIIDKLRGDYKLSQSTLIVVKEEWEGFKEGEGERAFEEDKRMGRRGATIYNPLPFINGRMASSLQQLKSPPICNQ